MKITVTETENSQLSHEFDWDDIKTKPGVYDCTYDPNWKVVIVKEQTSSKIVYYYVDTRKNYIEMLDEPAWKYRKFTISNKSISVNFSN